MAVDWQGMYPAVTTQFTDDYSINFDRTQQMDDALSNDGVHRVIVNDTFGDNGSWQPAQMRAVMQSAVEIVQTAKTSYLG